MGQAKLSPRLVLRPLILLMLLAGVSVSQVRPVNDYGALGLARLLKQLQTTASVMMIGAHPDDEDSALLAYLARGENARTAYLSLTRGDGGQNIIGPELFESLGVIRTEELLQARRLDGAEQYFTRAFDYGFSKTLAEAKSKWPEDVIKCDAVRAIRLFRPLVVISRFTGTPADGHGQHQYAGYITPIAVKAAADPQQCTDAGEPWQVKKFYVETSFSDNSVPTLKINTGTYDPILGRTYFEIAMEGRSQHRSQGEGRIEFHGDSFSGLNLVGVAKDGREKSIFDGLDVDLIGIPTASGFGKPVSEYTKTSLSKVQDLSQKLKSEYKIDEPNKILPDLVEARETMNELVWSYLTSSGPPERVQASHQRDQDERALIPAIHNELNLYTDAVQRAVGVQIDALANQETLAPGGELQVSAKIFFPDASGVSVKKIELQGWPSSDWTISKSQPDSGATVQRRETPKAEAIFVARLSDRASPTQPYWLSEPRTNDLFSWPDSESSKFALTLPFEFPVLRANVLVTIGGKDMYFSQPVQYRFADPARGEIRREVNVVPPVSVAIAKDVEIIPLGGGPPVRKVAVQVTNNTAASLAVTLGSTDPGIRGFHARFAKAAIQLGPKSSVSTDLELQIPENPNSAPFSVMAFAVIDGGTYAAEMHVVSYPHIQTHRYYTKAAIKLVPVDLKIASANIGYIMGSGDEVPEAIEQMGMKVTMLSDDEIASGDLSKFDSIVIGIRASETRPAFAANNPRLLDYARNGGNVIVQYQRNNWTGLAPYPVNIQDKQGTTAGSIARVVDENAAVNILDPQHPILNVPNKITAKDFEGWVQERNAYNLVTFDPQYTPLLESHDAGEQENKGGLVIAKVGKGNWIYCSYSFFRQLPAGVPGAYRLFANMLSLPRGK